MLHKRRLQKRKRWKRRSRNNANPNRDVLSSEIEAETSEEDPATRVVVVSRANAGGRVEAHSKIVRRIRKRMRFKNLLRVNRSKTAGRRSRQINRVVKDRDAHVQHVDDVPVQDVSTEEGVSESHKISLRRQQAVKVARQRANLAPMPCGLWRQVHRNR